jgi:DNA-binding transcriptional MerR regulator
VSYAKSGKDVLLIGELAELTDVSRDTLRHYERKGVLPRSVRSRNGYRLYSAKVVERVKLVRRALAFGFTLDEIARIFDERKQGNTPCQEVYRLAAAKLEDVKIRLCEMEILRDDLENLMFEWQKKLAGVSAGKAAHLLENLTVSPSKSNEKQKNELLKISAEKNNE